MGILKKNYQLIIAVGLFIAIYYTGIPFLKEDKITNIFVQLMLVFSLSIAFFIQTKNYKNISQKELQLFFKFLMLGTFAYIFGQLFKAVVIVSEKNGVFAIGLVDVLYFLQIFLYTSGFIYLLSKTKNRYRVVFYIIDTLFLINIFATISWKYMILPAVEKLQASPFETIITFSYPIFNMILLFVIILVSLQGCKFFRKDTFLLFLIATILQIVSTTLTFVHQFYQLEFSYHFLYPFTMISFFLIGKACFSYKNDVTSFEDDLHGKEFKISIPILHYIGVFFILVISIFEKDERSIILFGLVVTVFLMLIRDGFAVYHNRILTKRLKNFNRSLEQKVNERTFEISEKNKELANVLEKVEYIAKHDSLTGLPNRRYFEDYLGSKIIECSVKNKSFTVFLIDLDQFKHVNDTHGHHVGDGLLVKVTKRIKEKIRGKDFLARLGGDEFVVVLDDVDNAKDINRFANEILNISSEKFIIKNHEIHMTMSIGISTYPFNGENMQTLMKNADMAMYKAKDANNSAYVYNPDLQRDLGRKLNIVNDLKMAIYNQEFEVFYQPQFYTNGELSGVEALVRWNHATHGWISPGEFIPLAEEFNLVEKIDDFVIKTAVAQVVEWGKQGLPHLRLGVNISAQQFTRQDLIERIDGIIKEYKIKPNQLIIEITESIAMHQEKYLIQKLTELKDLGVEIALDDFGTGYSSLSYIKKFPIDKIKIAQQFIRDVPNDKKDMAIIKSIISLSHYLDLTVIAEGVETAEQLNYLKNLNCEEIQGFLLGKPMSPNQFEEKFLLSIKK